MDVEMSRKVAGDQGGKCRDTRWRTAKRHSTECRDIERHDNEHHDNERGDTKCHDTKRRDTKRRPSAGRELFSLVIKVGIIVLCGWVVLNVIFGLLRVDSPSMSPSIKAGDLVLFDRSDTNALAGEVVAYRFHDQETLGRVVAVAGDEVDIREGALYVNGSYQQESWAYGKTERFEGGPDMPLTVPDGSVFVLGDNRSAANDSRVAGCVNQDEIDGTVVGFLRRRNL